MLQRRFLLKYGAIIITVYMSVYLIFFLGPLVPATRQAPEVLRTKFKDLKVTKGGIPMLIHFVYKNSYVLGPYQNTLRKCLDLNKQWHIVLWTDESVHKFMDEFYANTTIKDVFYRYPHKTQRSDAIRYLILYNFGGVYMDMDTVCYSSLLPPIDHFKCFFDSERRHQTHILYNKEVTVMNSAMGCRPKHPFFETLINYVLDEARLKEKFIFPDSILTTTGPFVITDLYRWWPFKTGPNAVTVLNETYFSPYMDPSSIFYSCCRHILTGNSTASASSTNKKKFKRSKRLRSKGNLNNRVNKQRNIKKNYNRLGKEKYFEKNKRKKYSNKTEKKEDSDETAMKEDTDKTAKKEDTDKTAKKEDTDKTAKKEDTDKTAKKEDTDKTAKKEDTDKTAKKEDTDKTAKKEDTDKTAKEDTDKTAKKEDSDKTAKKEDSDKTAKKEDSDNTAKKKDSDKTAKDSDKSAKKDSDKTAKDSDKSAKKDSDKTAKKEDTDKTAKKDSDETPKKEDSDKPAKKEDSDKPAKKEDSDKPAKKEDSDKPAKKEDSDKPAKKEDSDKTAKENLDKTAKKENSDKTVKRADSDKSAKNKVVKTSEKDDKIVKRAAQIKSSQSNVRDEKQTFLQEKAIKLKHLVNSFFSFMLKKETQLKQSLPSMQLPKKSPIAHHCPPIMYKDGKLKPSQRAIKACRDLAAIGYEKGKNAFITNKTVAIHMFLHLGYGEHKIPKVSLYDEFPDVLSYQELMELLYGN